MGPAADPRARPSGVGARAGGRLLLTDRRPDTLPRPSAAAASTPTSGPDPGGQRAGVADAPHGPPLGPRDEVAARQRDVAHVHPRERDGGQPDARPRDRRERLRTAEPGRGRLPVADGAASWPVVWTVMAARRGRVPDGGHGPAVRRASPRCSGGEAAGGGGRGRADAPRGSDGDDPRRRRPRHRRDGPHHDPLLVVRTGRSRRRARRDRPLRDREHRPDRPRVHPRRPACRTSTRRGPRPTTPPGPERSPCRRARPS